MTAQLVEFEGHDVEPVPTVLKSHHLAGFLYAVEFESGLIKVGRALRPRDRVRAHRALLEPSDGALLRGWVSPAHTNYVETEKSLIASGHQLATHWRGVEYLYGARLDDLASVGRELPYQPPPEALPPMLGPELPGIMAANHLADLLRRPRAAIKLQIANGDIHAVCLCNRSYVPKPEVERILREDAS